MITSLTFFTSSEHKVREAEAILGIALPRHALELPEVQAVDVGEMVAEVSHWDKVLRVGRGTEGVQLIEQSDLVILTSDRLRDSRSVRLSGGIQGDPRV